MLNDSSSSSQLELSRPQAKPSKIMTVPWNPWYAVLFIGVVYYVSQFFGGMIVSLYPWLQHWTSAQANQWVTNSILAQFIYVVLAEAFMLAAIYVFLKKFKANFGLIGLTKPKWRDVSLGLVVAPLYYLIYIIAVAVISHFVPSFNINQVQNVGFTGVSSVAQLVLAFISLVFLPPLVEEIMVRGFLYSSLHKALPKIAAVIFTSLIFAGAHLPEGGAAGPLYIAALDTFILSLVLIYLRERTGSLWASITLHGLKNGIAFLALYVLSFH